MSKLRLVFAAALLVLVALSLWAQPINAVLIPDYTTNNPDEDGYVVLFAGPVYSRNTVGNVFAIGQTGGGTGRGYIQWPTTTIPDNSTILKVQITFKVFQGGAACDLMPLVNKPSTATDVNLYTDIGDGTKYLTTASLVNGATYTYSLGSSANSNLQGLLASDWFGAGFLNDARNPELDIYSEEGIGIGGIAPILTVTYSYMGVYYTFNAKWENGTATTVTAIFISSDGSTTTTITTGDVIGFTIRPQYVTWEISTGYNRRIYFVADTGNHTLFIPETSFAVFTAQIRDFTGITQSETVYLETTRAIGGSYQTIEYIPVTSTINGVPVTLAAYRVYVLGVDTSGTDYSFTFFSTISTPSPILILTPPTYSDIFQFNTRYIHVQATRPVPANITFTYLDDLANTTITVLNIYYRNSTLVATWNTTSDNFSHTFTGLSPSTDYVAEANITHGEYGALLYRRTLSGTWTPATPPDLSGLGTFGALDMTQVMGGFIIILTAALFSAWNAAGGLFITAIVAALMGYYGWVTINSGVIVFVMVIAVAYAWGRSRN